MPHSLAISTSSRQLWLVSSPDQGKLQLLKIPVAKIKKTAKTVLLA
jgi:hypothetical protein